MEKKYNKLYLVPPLSPEDRDGGDNGDTGYPKRIDVAVNHDMVDAIRGVIEDQDVGLTEAVRRLIMVGHFVTQAMTREDSRILIERPDGNIQEMLLRDPDL